DRAPSDPAYLAHETREEHGVTCLVDLLRDEEVLLLLEWRGLDVRGQSVGNGVLAPEEEGVVPERRLALELAELLLPLAPVLAEVQLGRSPVPLLPAR